MRAETSKEAVLFERTGRRVGGLVDPSLPVCSCGIGPTLLGTGCEAWKTTIAKKRAEIKAMTRSQLTSHLKAAGLPAGDKKKRKADLEERLLYHHFGTGDLEAYYNTYADALLSLTASSPHSRPHELYRHSFRGVDYANRNMNQMHFTKAKNEQLSLFLVNLEIAVHNAETAYLYQRAGGADLDIHELRRTLGARLVKAAQPSSSA